MILSTILHQLTKLESLKIRNTFAPLNRRFLSQSHGNPFRHVANHCPLPQILTLVIEGNHDSHASRHALDFVGPINMPHSKKTDVFLPSTCPTVFPPGKYCGISFWDLSGSPLFLTFCQAVGPGRWCLDIVGNQKIIILITHLLNNINKIILKRRCLPIIKKTNHISWYILYNYKVINFFIYIKYLSYLKARNGLVK